MLTLMVLIFIVTFAVEFVRIVMNPDSFSGRDTLPYNDMQALPENKIPEVQGCAMCPFAENCADWGNPDTCEYPEYM